MIPYYSPNFSFLDLLRTICCKNADRKLRVYFQQITGKKYVLFTSSCRSALYLAYQSIGKKGVVHTSPLTCKVALLPVTASGNKIYFHDVKETDWTLDPESIPPAISKESVAIQAIHLGGFLCDMPALRKISDDHNLILIEDCAQGFSSSYNGVPAGTMGDIACFTLCKNVFGIGGGVLVTNNLGWYHQAKQLQGAFPRESLTKVAYRLFGALLGTSRTNSGDDMLYGILTKIKKKYAHNKQNNNDDILDKELRKPSVFYSKSFAARIRKIENLNIKRKVTAEQIISHLSLHGYRFQMNMMSRSGYTKLFSIHRSVQSANSIRALSNAGIEAMHLEHKFKRYYQSPLIPNQDVSDNTMRMMFPVYHSIHDNLVSWPLFESMGEKELKTMERDAINVATR